MWNLFQKPKTRDLPTVELTDEQLLSLVAERFNLTPETLTKIEEDKVYEDLGGVENFITLLNGFMSRDIKKHFKAQSPAEQVLARGMFARAVYLKSRILKTKEKAQKDVEIPKIGKRYAK